MTIIRYITEEDKNFWFKLDRHLSELEYSRKIRDKMGYVLLDNDTYIGLLRYNLFWDGIPFCNLIFIDSSYQRQGYGRKLLEYWEADMKALGYDLVMTSTQSDESAQHFYRKQGYKDSGGLLINVPNHEQPMELFFVKGL